MTPFYPKSRLEQPARPGGVRPGVEAAACAVSTLGDPHLLERRPVVREAATEQVVRGVALHEAAVHLQAAPVRVARVAPRAFVAMDAKPLPLVGRVQVGDIRAPRGAPHRAQRADGARPDGDGRTPRSHRRLPAPGRGSQAAETLHVDEAVLLLDADLGGAGEKLLRR